MFTAFLFSHPFLRDLRALLSNSFIALRFCLSFSSVSKARNPSIENGSVRSRPVRAPQPFSITAPSAPVKKFTSTEMSKNNGIRFDRECRSLKRTDVESASISLEPRAASLIERHNNGVNRICRSISKCLELRTVHALRWISPTTRSSTMVSSAAGHFVDFCSVRWALRRRARGERSYRPATSAKKLLCRRAVAWSL